MSTNRGWKGQATDSREHLFITMLQHLDAVRYTEPASENGPSEVTESDSEIVSAQLPNLVLAIEEPELYQHPSRQRHLASVLLNLAIGVIPGVAESTQVVYATHSPLFVGLDRFDQIRVLRKVPQGEDKPKATRINRTDMKAVAEELCMQAVSKMRCSLQIHSDLAFIL